MTRSEARRFPFAEPVGLEIEPLFAVLRESEPVSRIRLPYGGEGWFVSGYEDNRRLLNDRRFSRAASQGEMPRLTVEPAGGSAMAILDPPEHTRIRRLVAAEFAAPRVQELRPQIQQTAGELIAALTAAGPPADLIAEFALLLPIKVICGLLGVPYADRDRFSSLARVLLSSTAYTREQVGAAVEELGDYLYDLIDQRRENPTGDLIGVLVSARDVDDRLSEEELITLCGTLLGAGFENVANSIGNMTFLLLTHPDELRALREHRELIPAAVEEMLRYAMAGLGASHARIAMEDLEIAGVPIRRGEAVFASLPSANHDPAVFRDPEVLDFRRAHNPHLAFGHGPHVCLGAHLARLELQVALAALLEAFPDLALAVPAQEVPWKIGLTVRGPESLPVRW
ncbi:MAG: cytochrome P450 [Catenulispora sp.]|nr:cytochrome P450 [Catenulispora sp.]